MNEVTAPDLYGLVPDDAACMCYERDLAVAVNVADMVEVRGWNPVRARITQQWPSPGSRIDSRTVVVLVDLVDGGGNAGVREPRWPSPPLRSPGTALDDESALGSIDRWQPLVPNASEAALDHEPASVSLSGPFRAAVLGVLDIPAPKKVLELDPGS